jgi:type VI secretion system VasD/TssJ family lipoprotein
MKRLPIVLTAGVLLCCCSCSQLPAHPAAPAVPSPPSLPAVQAAPTAAVGDPGRVESSRVSFRKDDLAISISADTGLNRFRNSAHALYLCLYQLKDPNAFNQLAEEKEGMGRLLECNRFDSSVANARRFVVQPGQQLKETRDRAEGARYLGIATGYYGNGREKVTHLAPLEVKNGEPSGHAVAIELGPHQIERITVK